jgi:uncharacterized membrane protein YkvA (DUF1232 family)
MPQEKVYEDAEVHDMNDMGHGSSREGSSAKKVQNGAPVVWKALSVIIAMMALAYDISPLDLSPDAVPVLGWLDAVLGWLDDAGTTLVAALISPLDLSPDTIPVLGWLDDAGITVMAALNAYQQFAKDQNAISVHLAKYVKWMMVAVLVIAAAVIIGLYVTIPRLD